jgi:predicted metalloendopeptidase
MLRNVIKPLSVAVVACVLSACSTVDGLRPTDEGVTVYASGKSYDEVWKASVRAMSSNLAMVDSSKAQGVIKSEAPAGFATWGEVVGVFISPPSKDASVYTIHVVSNKRATYQVTGQDWAPSVAGRIKAELDID